GSLGQALGGDSEDPIVLAQGWDKSGLHSLQLKAQDIESISPLDGIIDPGKDGNAEVLNVPGKQARRSADADLGSELEESPDVAPRHPGVQDVAADRNLDSLETAQAVPQRKQVEQALGRMFVLAVARVDDIRPDA